MSHEVTIGRAEQLQWQTKVASGSRLKRHASGLRGDKRPGPDHAENDPPAAIPVELRFPLVRLLRPDSPLRIFGASRICTRTGFRQVAQTIARFFRRLFLQRTQYLSRFSMKVQLCRILSSQKVSFLTEMEGTNMTMKRHRDVSGREERKRNDTYVRTLREEYGEKFAPKAAETTTLRNVKESLGLEPDASLNKVLERYGIKRKAA